MKSNKKYYIVDLGIRNHILPKKQYDLGFSIENIVYFELLRRGYQVNVGRVKEAEIAPLEKIKDNYDKIILTFDEYSVGNYNGIKVINILDWLLA
ncbi:MAG: hypothetical protein ACI4U3_08940 [Traorella sp.]